MNVAVSDAAGRMTVRVVPDGAHERTWAAGVVLGPPDLSVLQLPEEVTTRLHNELFNRQIIRRSDARRARAEVVAALMAALRVDADRIIQAYEENGNG